MKHPFKRLCALLLVLCMVLSILPASVFALPDLKLTATAVIQKADGTTLPTLPLGNPTVTTNSYYGPVTVKFNPPYATMLSTLAEAHWVEYRLYDADSYDEENPEDSSLNWQCESFTLVGDTLTIAFRGEIPAVNNFILTILLKEPVYNVDFAGTGISWKDLPKTEIVTLPTLPLEDEQWLVGWKTPDGREFLPGAEVTMTTLFGAVVAETSMTLTQTYIDRAEEHFVLWADSLTGQIYGYETVANGATVVGIAEPVKDGYDFDAWDKATDEPITENTVFLAGWTPKHYAIMKDDSSEVELTLMSDTAATGETVTVLLEAPEGSAIDYAYAFTPSGLFVPMVRMAADGAHEYQFTMPAREVFVGAILKDLPAETSTITFYDDNNNVVHTLVVENGTVIGVPDAPKKTGYTFTGWVNSDGVELTPETVAGGNDTYTATYEAVTYKITVENNSDHITVDAPETAKYGELVDFSLTVDPGYETYYVYADTSDYIPVAVTDMGDHSYKLTMPADDVWIVVGDQPIRNTVKFVSDNDVVAFEYVASGVAPTAPVPNPVKEGHRFLGWTAESTGTFYPAGTAFDPILADETYTATYTANPVFMFVHDYNGETIAIQNSDNEQLKYGDWFLMPEAPETENGQIFLGWSSQPDGAFYVANGFYQCTSSSPFVRLYPVYETNSEYWTVKYYNPDGSIFDVDLVEKDEEASVTLPVYAPYVDAQWLDEEEILHNAGDVIEVGGDMRLTAVVPETYRIDFMADGYQVATRFVENGTVIDAPDAPKKTGYAFTGWVNTDGVELTPETVAGGNDTYTATYEAVTYEITVENNSDHITVDAPENAKYGELVEFSLTVDPGYETYYVYADTNDYIPVAVTDMGDHSYKLTMPADDVWIVVGDQPVRNTVKFVSDNDVVAFEYVASGVAPTAPVPNPVKEGHRFLGWTAESTGTFYPAGTAFDPILADETYTATYEAVTYEIKVDNYSDHITVDAPENAKYGELVEFSLTVDPGYETYYVYADTNDFIPVAVTDMGNHSYKLTMPADDVWIVVGDQPIRNTVKFVSDNDVVAFEYVASGVAPTAPVPNPVKEGHRFLGWTAESTGTFYPAGTAFDPILADETYTATYTANPVFMFVHDYNGETIVIQNSDNEQLKYGDWFLMPEAPETEIGQIFLGWSSQPDGAFYVANGYYQCTSSSPFVRLYPVYETNSEYWTVKYYNPDGSLYDIDLVEKDEEASVTLPVYAPYEDAQWLDEEEILHNAGDVIEVGGDMRFTAVVPEAYRIDFMADGYMVNWLYALDNETIYDRAPLAPAKAGYTFVGWVNTDGVELTPETVVGGNDTYTAVYEAATYKITVENYSDHITVDAPETATYGEMVEFYLTVDPGYETYYVYADTSDFIPVAVTDMGYHMYKFTMPADDVWIVVDDQPIRNTVKFVVDNDVVAFEYVASGVAPTAPVPDPVKEGYEFLGWTAESTGTFYPAGTAFDPIIADETYTAEFEVMAYDLTYYRGAEADASEFKCILALPDGSFVEFFNNDTINMPTYVVYDIVYGERIVLAEPTLPGYIFQFWIDEDGNHWYAGQTFTMPANDVLLTAVWAVDTGLNTLVTFVNEGEIYAAYLAYEGQTGTIPEIDPSAPGRTFIGWRYDDVVYSHSGVKEFDIVVGENRTMVLEAVWEDDVYTITYSGDAVDIAPVTDLAYGDEVVLADAPKNEGYTFLAWENTLTGAYYDARAAVTVTGDMNLVAVWQKNEVQFAVKFFAENGNLFDIFVVAEGETIVAPEYTEGRDDAEYIWIEEEAHLYYYGGETFAVTSNLSFRAVLVSEAEYGVIVGVSPDYAPQDIATLPQDSYFYGESVTVEIMVPDGYILKNVSTLGVTNGLLPTKDSLIHVGDNFYLYVFEMPQADVLLYIEMEEIPAGSTVVKFLADGELYDYAVITKGTNGNAPDVPPTKDGYEFLYWQSGTTIVKAGEPFAVPSDAMDEIIFTAVYKQLGYLVSYDTAGGVPQPSPKTHLYGKQITLAAAPQLDGYEFLGWVEDSTGFLYGEGATYTVKGDVTFTARWEFIPLEEYIVKFIDKDTNQIFGYEIVEEGGTVTAPAGPSFTGKTFVAWENETGAQILPGNETAAIYADTVYYATYTVNTHAVYVNTTNCSLSPAAFGTPEVGSLVEFTVTPAEGHAVETVTISYMDGPALMVRMLTPAADGTYSFYMPDAAVTITATAKQNVFSIFTEPLGNSVIDLIDNKAEVGETVLFFVSTNNSDDVVSNVWVMTTGGQIIHTTRYDYGNGIYGYAFVMPEADVIIFAESVKAEFTVTYLDSDNTLLGIYPVNSGEYAGAPTPVKDGYTFAGWVILPSGQAFDPATDAVTENLVVRATYVGDEQTVAAGKTDNVAYLQAECTVSSGNVNSSNLLLTELLKAETGKTVYFTVAAEYDYVITDIAVVSAEGTDLVVTPVLREKKTVDNLVYYTYAFEMPAENVLIDVYTAPKAFKTTVVENIPAGGEYTINGYYTSNLMIMQGEEVVIDVMPNDGYIVKNIYGTYIDNLGNVANLDGVFENNTFTYTMIAKDVTIYVEYEAIVYGIDIQTSNFASYKPDASVNPAKVVESLDPELTSKGLITFVGGALEDYTNTLEQVYKIPSNGAATIGERIAFTVTEYTGYDLVGVTVTYDNGEMSCPLTFTNGVYYFDMPADDVIITAEFTEETYTVTKDAASELHGAVVMNGLTENAISADYKDEVTVTVTPDEGYQVTKISYTLANGDVMDFDKASYTAATTLTDALDTEHSITFHMPASDVTVSVEYAAIDYSITDVTANATTTYTTPHTVGEQVSVTTAADYGYIITAVYAINDTTGERVYLHTDSTNTIYGADYYFTMPASSVTIHVESVKDEFNVIYLANGSIVDYEDVDYMEQANVASRVSMVNAAPAGYHFVGWTSEEVQTPVTVPSVNNADFVIVKDRTYIVAAYEKDEIDVVFEAVENGTVTEQSTGNTAAYTLDTTVFGDKVTFTAVPDAGYVVDTVSVTTTNSEGYNLNVRYTVTGETYTFTIPASYKADVHTVQAEDVIVNVTFKKAAYTLTRAADSETNGTIAINGIVTTQTSFTYFYQDAVTITATPNAGYYVAGITAVNADGSVVYTATGSKPANNTPAGDPLTLSFLMPDCDLTYTVDYEKIDYTITTVFNAEQGEVTTSPADVAQLGDIVTVTVTPKLGYVLQGLTATYANGEKSLVLTEIAANTFTFTMPAEPVVVTAIFNEDVYNVSMTVEGEAEATLNGDYTYAITAQYLDTLTINVKPAAGWELVSITVNDGAVKVNEEIKAAGGEYTFTMPNADAKIVVKLEKTGFTMDSYALNFFEYGHGSVTLNPDDTAYVGDRIIISADPDDGYRVKEVVVLDKFGYSVPVSFVSGTPGYLETWSFTMPAFDVEIFVYFEVQGSSYYDDVRTDFWFYEAVTFVTDRGYFNGISETLFAPNMNMNRAMFVTVLGRISDVDTSKYTNLAFADLKAGAYYVPYVAWAAENGIVLGRDADTFDPDASITREEMAAVMYRYCDYLGIDMTPQNEMFMDRYTDTGEISGWAVKYVEWAVGVGLIRGMSDTTIDPLGLATRAQVAQVIKNLCDKVLYQ